MIRVTVELYPDGLLNGRRTIARMDIANVGGDYDIGNYTVEAEEAANMHRGAREREAAVTGHERKASIWALVAAAAAAVSN